MKKLIPLVLLILLVIIKADVQAQTMVSLNGVNADTAKKMISNYETYIRTPGNKLILKQQNVWFDKATFKSMLDYVDSINTANINQPQQQIDGIRMYLGMSGDPSSKFVCQLIMVATKNDGKCDTCRVSGAYHKDVYFDASAPVFHLKNIQGQTMFKRWIFGQGETLYRHNATADDTACYNTGPHYITIKQAQTWVDNDTSSVGMKTFSEWFDVGLLDAFAQEPNHDGIRIYLAKHGPNDTDKYQDVRNKDICIFETTRSSWFTHKDYFDCSVSSIYFNKSKPNLDKLNKLISPHAMIITPGGGSGPGGQDNGELCPDNCTQ
jgi:hypothetical protein